MKFLRLLILLICFSYAGESYAVGTCSNGTYVPDDSKSKFFDVAITDLSKSFKDGGCNLGQSYQSRINRSEEGKTETDAKKTLLDQSNLTLCKYGCNNNTTVNDPMLASMTYYIGIMGSAICATMSIITHSMLMIYCSILFAWTPIVTIMMVIYIAIYAVSIIFGINNVQLRDLFFRAIKMTIVYMLATKPELFVLWVYDFFVSTLMDVFSVVSASITDKCSDAGIRKCLYAFSMQGGNTSLSTIFFNIDQLFGTVVGDASTVGLAAVAAAVVFYVGGQGVFILMFVVTGIAASFFSFMRLLITFTTAFMGLIFVMMFTPIFVSAVLFEKTKRFFTGWLATLISYVMQPLVIIIFLAMIGKATEFSTFTGFKYVDKQVMFNAKLQLKTPIKDPDDPNKMIHFRTISVPAVTMNYKHKLGSEVGKEFEVSGPKLTDEFIALVSCDFASLNTATNFFKDNSITTNDVYCLIPSQVGALAAKDKPRSVFHYFIGIGAAWIMLSALTAAFLNIVPLFARDLARWQNHQGTPAIGGKSATLDSIANSAPARGQSEVYSLGETFSGVGGGLVNSMGNLPFVGEKIRDVTDAAGDPEKLWSYIGKLIYQKPKTDDKKRDPNKPEKKNNDEEGGDDDK